MSEVYLLVYTFQLLKILTLQHTEIRVHGRDIAYGKLGISIKLNGVRTDMKLLKVIHCGRTDVTDLDLTQYLIHINAFFTKETYRLFNNNCRKFSTVILNFLETDEPDEGKIVITPKRKHVLKLIRIWNHSTPVHAILDLSTINHGTKLSKSS